MKPGDLVLTLTVGTGCWGDLVLIIREDPEPTFAWLVLQTDGRVCRITPHFLVPIP